MPIEVLEECASLYSKHYGTWGAASPRHGDAVRITGKRAHAWLKSPDSNLALARDHTGTLIGYAIIVETKVPKYGIVSWVTQLVVHAAHRRANVAKVLLFSTWKASDRVAWGIVTANPFAVRALEKATRRRCVPGRISRSCRKLLQIGLEHVPYISDSTEFLVNSQQSMVNTEFLLDHSQIPSMIASDVSADKPWLLGSLDEGWEWLAFTFRDQAQISLTRDELNEMLLGSDDVTRRAYARMTLDSAHAWTRHSEAEVKFVLKECHMSPGQSILDFGCGNGRHTFGFWDAGLRSVGVDYVLRGGITADQRDESAPPKTMFVEADCRTVELDRQFDGAVCLYDVIGSYADDTHNGQLLSNMARHLKHGAYCLISVMNLVATIAKATNLLDVALEPDRLLELPPSHTMEATGNIFDPKYYLVDVPTGVVYRKEQFQRGSSLPEELLVRDRSFTKESIASLCNASGLDVVWSRFVSAGKWNDEGDPEKAKEILVLCRKPLDITHAC